MTESYEFSEPERFTAGTVGEPGRRVFFLQSRAHGVLVTLKCEKQQVGALAEHLAALLADLPEPAEPELTDVDVEFETVGPVEWAIGRMGVAWDEARDRLVLMCEELTVEDGEEDEEADEAAGPGDDAAGSRASARFQLTRAQIAAFIDVARDLIAGGRPPCYLCGGPMDPEGHACPRWN